MKNSYLHFRVLNIVLIYAGISALWIVLSDTIIEWFTQDPLFLTRLSTLKGIFFILVTSVVLYVLIRRYTTEIEDKEGQVRRRNRELVAMTGELERQLAELRRQEQQLAESEERFRRAIVYSPFPLMIHAENGEVVMLSKSWTEITGYEPADIATMEAWLDKAYRGDYAEIKPEIESLYVLDRHIDEGEYTIFTQNGQKRNWFFSSAPLGSISGKGRVVISMAMDITERKKMEEALKRRNTELNQFAYIISHDLKAPLRAISNLSQWIEEDLEDKLTEESRENMFLLRQRVQRMQDMIQGILAYSRAGRTLTAGSRCDVRELIREVVADMAPPQGFEIRLGEGFPVLYTDGLGLRQVFANLIDNAIKHHDKPAGRVEIAVQEQESWYVFSVADDGPGIAAEYHQKVFELFQVLTPRDSKESTGVGLALVKKIVENQGGRISIESQKDHGLTIAFTWPKVYGDAVEKEREG